MKIALSSFTEDDIDSLISWVDAPGASDLWASSTYPYPLSRETVYKHFQKTQAMPIQLRIFKILNDENSKTLGHIELDKFNHQDHSARITRLFVDPKYREQGVARASIQLLLKHCFEELELKRVEILALEINQIAIHLYQGIGFKKEKFIKDYKLINGEYCGSHVMSMLNSDYKKIKVLKSTFPR